MKQSTTVTIIGGNPSIEVRACTSPREDEAELIADWDDDLYLLRTPPREWLSGPFTRDLLQIAQP